MPTMLRDERSLRECASRLRDSYDRARQRLHSLTARPARGKDELGAVSDLSVVLADVNGADQLLRQLVEAWNHCTPMLQRRLSDDIERLRLSAASCLELVSAAEREFGRQREQVVQRMDEGVKRNRAVRAYSNALRQ